MSTHLRLKGISVPDMINHPSHYTSHPSGVECITITRHQSFNIGNAMKYIWRADAKGAPIEDLKKAIWYLNDEIKLREEKKEIIQPRVQHVSSEAT